MAETPILRLPTGMRDHAPEAASARRRIVDGLLATFERHGFARVITPAFEYEDVLALGLGDAARAATVRFVEPSSGEVVALRPDITPQIARLIATRYRDEPGPVRLCYEGTVVRLERGARGQRELMQAGVEVAGVPGPDGDADAIALAVEALAAVGLARPTVDLGHLGLAREVLTALALPDAALGEARRCIAKHDGAGLGDVLKHARGGKAAIAFARLLPELSGGPDVLDAARAQAPNGGIKRALAELAAIVAAVRGRKLEARLHVGLGVVRGGVTCVLGEAMVVDPTVLVEEVRAFRSQGFLARHEDLVVAARAHLTMPYHRDIDRLRDERAENAIGTTRKGIGPTYESK